VLAVDVYSPRSAVTQQPTTLEIFSPYRDAATPQAFELGELGTSAKREQRGARESKREHKRREKLEQLREADEMKFSHSLQFNAVPDWSNHYIAYSNLKKQYVRHVGKELGDIWHDDADRCYLVVSTASKRRSTRSMLTTTPNRRHS
jgi:hypothetical protein